MFVHVGRFRSGGVWDGSGVGGFHCRGAVGGAAEMPQRCQPRKDRLDPSVGIALGSASQIALFVGPIVVLFSYVIDTVPTDLQF
jgi:Ca2+:H+ antiporter